MCHLKSAFIQHEYFKPEIINGLIIFLSSKNTSDFVLFRFFIVNVILLIKVTRCTNDVIS